MNITLRSLLFIAFIFTAGSAFGANLGVYGQVFPIAEPDFLDFIHQRLEELQQSGQIAQMENNFKANVIAHTLRPTPISGITTINSNQILYYDPTFTLPQDITDNQGNLIAPKGTKINPLAKITFNEALIFIDADDPLQVKMAKSASDYYLYQGKLVKIILVEGDMRAAGNALGRVYFDQDGVITRKLGIAHVPAVVTQEGLKLRIDEYIDNGVFPLSQNEKSKGGANANS